MFDRSSTGWRQSAYVKPANTGRRDRFGSAVALDGDALVVGSPHEDGAGTTPSDDSAFTAGAAYVFRRVGQAWFQEAYLKASNADVRDRFGASVAISGESVLIGAAGEDSAATGVDGDAADESADGAGAAYLFVHSGPSWSEQAYLKASNSRATWTWGTRSGTRWPSRATR